MKEKLTSRKFWLSTAAFLGSVAASIAGLVTDHEWVTIIGVVCGILSAAIYAAAEAYVDAHEVSAKTISAIVDVTSVEELEKIFGKVA